MPVIGFERTLCQLLTGMRKPESTCTGALKAALRPFNPEHLPNDNIVDWSELRAFCR